MAQKETVGARFPAVTLSFAFMSLLVYCWPHLPDLFVYDRQAILQGEVWRLFTAPFVHFSGSHLFWDLFVYSAAGWKIEAAGYRRYWLVCCLAAAIPGPVFLLASPELARYGGISGLATGAVVYLCLCEIKAKGRNRILWLGILVLVGLKIMVEAATGTPIFAAAADIRFRVLPSVHFIGFAAAVAALLLNRPRAAHLDAARPHSRLFACRVVDRNNAAGASVNRDLEPRSFLK